MKVNRAEVEIIVECPFCGSVDAVWVNEEDYIEWQSGELVQVAFPYLNATEREMLISGMCPSCQKKVYGEQG